MVVHSVMKPRLISTIYLVRFWHLKGFVGYSRETLEGKHKEIDFQTLKYCGNKASQHYNKGLLR